MSVLVWVVSATISTLLCAIEVWGLCNAKPTEVCVQIVMHSPLCNGSVIHGQMSV